MLRRFLFATALAVVSPFVAAGQASVDLAIAVSDGRTTINPGQGLLYLIDVDNGGPSNATDAHVTATLPAACASPTWTCAGTGTCPATGSGNIDANVTLPALSRATFRVQCPVDAAAGGTTLTTTATVEPPAGVIDPSLANNSATDTTYVIPVRGREVTKTVTGSFQPGGTVTYTIVIRNISEIAQTDNAGPELIDGLPGGLHVTSMTATSGVLAQDGPVTWDGAIPAGGSVTITIVATIDPALTGAVYNQAIVYYDADGNGSNERTMVSDDPSTSAPDDRTRFDSVPPTKLRAALQGPATALAGYEVFYIVFLSNDGAPQADNPGDEFVDVLPAGLTLVEASALSGTVTADIATNTVRWNGALGLNASTQISIRARSGAGVRGAISNQGTLHYDADSNGSNESSALTDDPSQPGDADPTVTTLTSLPPAFDVKMNAYGDFANNGVVSFDLVVVNYGGTLQRDNPGDEIVDVLPEGMTYLGVFASHGTTAYDPATRTFTWNGEIPAGGFAGMTITARLPARAAGQYSTQAVFHYDADENGTNESTMLSDNPLTPTAGDPVVFGVTEAIPALGAPALAVVALGMWWMGRRRLVLCFKNN